MPHSFDYIVIGAGPAGCALAARLARSAGVPQVALVEAGPRRPSGWSRVPLGMAALVGWRNRHNYAYRTVPQAGLNGRCGLVPRGRGVGGSSLINAMIYIRGQPEDYDGWARAGCTGWDWDAVLPYFIDSEANARGADAWHGADGPQAVADLASPNPLARAFIAAAGECGIVHNPDFNGARQEGAGLYQVFQRAGRRLDAGSAWLTDAGVLPNLSILADTTVEAIRFDGRRACGVCVRRDGQVEALAARREVIVCAGAIDSPKLLMLSGIGPGAQLQRSGVAVRVDAPEVGGNLQDHLDLTLRRFVHSSAAVSHHPLTLWRALCALPAFRRGRGMLTSNIAEAGAFIRSAEEVSRPDLQLHFCIAPVEQHGRRAHWHAGVALHVCALRPYSRGRITLAGPDPSAPARIDPQFLSAPEDLVLLTRGARRVLAILNAPALARFGGTVSPLPATDDDADWHVLIRAHADTIYHPVGTCRMGADVHSVVDPHLRVRGVECLRVADASIMPTLISGNTQAAAAMIGAKAADLMLRQPA